jgi:hypothetical protein
MKRIAFPNPLARAARGRWLLGAAGLVILLSILSGCSEPRGTVSGKVTYKDKALPGGTVVFVTEDTKKQEMVTIQPDGSYSSSNVPLGKVLVAVQPAPKNPMANMPKGAQKPKLPTDSPAANYGQSGAEYVDIPQDLRDPFKSKITLNVERGEQVFNIPLKD